MPDTELLEKAKTHHREGQIQEAETLYREILNDTPNDADTLHLLGVLAFQCGRNDEAVSLIGEALRNRPDFPVAYNNLGSALNALQRFGEALEAFDTAIAAQPDFADAYYNKGVALQGLNKDEEAITAYQHALQLEPAMLGAEINQAVVLNRQGRRTDAIAALERAIELAPNSAEAHFNLGSFLLADRQLERAAGEFEQTTQLAPGLLQAHLNHGVALKSLSRPQQAIAAFERAVEIDPDCAPAQFELTRLLFEEGDPRASDARLNLGVALLRNGDAEGALRAFDANLELALPRTRELALKAVALRELGRWDEVKAHIHCEKFLRRVTLGAGEAPSPGTLARIAETDAAGSVFAPSDDESLSALAATLTRELERYRDDLGESHPFTEDAKCDLELVCGTGQPSEIDETLPVYHPDAAIVALYVRPAKSPVKLEIGCPDVTLRVWDPITEIELDADTAWILPAFWHYKIRTDEPASSCNALIFEWRSPALTPGK